MSVAFVNAKLVTMAGEGPGASGPATPGRRGDTVVVEGERIASVGDGATKIPPGARVVDAGGRVLMPGFVDCHTHACWAGDRLDEWDLRRSGVGYLDILRAGGGIMSTVRAVRAASESELVDGLLERLDAVLAAGTTTIEVKSGYGLNPSDELKMLRAIRAAAARFRGTVVATALLGHAMDPEEVSRRGEDGYVDWMIREALPAVTAEFPGIAVDAYCESGAWSVEQCIRLFEAARGAGHPLRVHADQFNSLGMVTRAIALGALSVDHLEASTDEDLAALAGSPATFGVVLPICGLHMDDRYARAHRLVESARAGRRVARVAVATNLNPGSAPSGSMPLAIGLAVRKCGLTPAEALLAATAIPARLLGLQDRGVIAPGMRADLLLLAVRDERELAYGFGHGAVAMVMSGGRIVVESAGSGRVAAAKGS